MEKYMICLKSFMLKVKRFVRRKSNQSVIKRVGLRGVRKKGERIKGERIFNHYEVLNYKMVKDLVYDNYVLKVRLPELVYVVGKSGYNYMGNWRFVEDLRYLFLKLEVGDVYKNTGYCLQFFLYNNLLKEYICVWKVYDRNISSTWGSNYQIDNILKLVDVFLRVVKRKIGSGFNLKQPVLLKIVKVNYENNIQTPANTVLGLAYAGKYLTGMGFNFNLNRIGFRKYSILTDSKPIDSGRIEEVEVLDEDLSNDPVDVGDIVEVGSENLKDVNVGNKERDKDKDLEIVNLYDTYEEGRLIDVDVKILLEKRIYTLKTDLVKVYNEIDRLNEKGFVVTREFLNKDLYPSLYNTMNSYVKNQEIGSGINQEMVDGARYLDDLGLKYVLKWSYNVIMLRLYLEYVDIMNCVSVNEWEGFGDTNDLIVDLSNDVLEIYSRMEPSIRSKLQKRGVTVVKNIYTGFDTEYQNIEVGKNELLSIQLCVSTRIIIQIPIQIGFSIGYTKDLNIMHNRIQDDIESLIRKIRLLKFKNSDSSVEFIANCFKRDGVKSVINKDKEVESFIFEPTTRELWFELLSNTTLKYLVNTSNRIAGTKLRKSMEDILNSLRNSFKEEEEVESNKIPSEFKLSMDWLSVDNDKIIDHDDLHNRDQIIGDDYSRTKLRSFTTDPINIVIRNNNYFIGHFVHADLSMLSDFPEFKEELSIINNCFVTLRSIKMCGVNFILRDTVLLSPAGSSLDSIGKLYGDDFKKVDVEKDWKSKMKEYSQSFPDKFKKYAVQDSVIPLIHGLSMEAYNHNQDKMGIPLTISTLASAYISKQWIIDSYEGYQISRKLSLGNLSNIYTPTGLRSTNRAVLQIGSYIKNFRGGRNECFMYGYNLNDSWFDYDLTSAYTTAMSIMGDPLYRQGRFYSAKKLEELMSENDFMDWLINSYAIISVQFNFNKNVKYPSIPVNVDDNISIYPLKGEAVLTGSEYLLARIQGCRLTVKNCYRIPFGEYKPYFNVINSLQKERRKHKKGTFSNLLMKLMSNICYGLTSRGISNSKSFDIRTNKQVVVPGGKLSNPILASWTTAFVRSVIGELLHNIDILGGKVMSVTTDGFLTNIPDLEEVIMKADSEKKLQAPLLKLYKETRNTLSGDPTGLEMKSGNIKGIYSWTTRGQYSEDGKVAATTGLQRSSIDKDVLRGNMSEIMNKKGDKTVGFIQKRLTSALEVYKKNVQVSSLFSDRSFSLYNDNKRVFEVDAVDGLHDSKPFYVSSECVLNRYVAEVGRKELYLKNTPVKVFTKKYENYLDIAVRKFVRGLFSNEFGLDKSLFKNYQEISDFLSVVPGVTMKVNTIAQLKRRPVSHGILMEVPEILEFADYLHKSGKFPNFDKDSFMKGSTSGLKKRFD